MADLSASITRPVIMIDDDPEDLDMALEMVANLHIPNQLITFADPVEALAFLIKTSDPPFFIICDVNMPKMDGFEFRTELLKQAGIGEIPFFFLSTSRSPGEIVLARECRAHGYYQKAGSFIEQEKILTEMFLSAKEILEKK